MDPTQRATRGYLQAVLAQTTWSATELARRCKLAPSTLNRFLHDDRVTHSLSARTLAKISEVSGVALPPALGGGQGESVAGAAMTQLPEGAKPGGFSRGRDLPVRGRAQGGPDGAILLDPDPIDWTWRPAELQGARDAFAMFVTGASMGDILPEGTTIFVHPNFPARPNDFVVVEKPGHIALIKRLVRRTGENLILRQYDPPKDLSLKREELVAVYRVIGAIYP